MTTVRLEASQQTRAEGIKRRALRVLLDHFLEKTGPLAKQMECLGIGNLVMENDGRTPQDVATEVLMRVDISRAPVRVGDAAWSPNPHRRDAFANCTFTRLPAGLGPRAGGSAPATPARPRSAHSRALLLAQDSGDHSSWERGVVQVDVVILWILSHLLDHGRADTFDTS